MGNKILAGRYEIYEKVGDGGMAVVYKARDKLLNRLVAIKILRPEYVKDATFVESFRRESRSAASLSHPNIVNIYDVGKEGSIYYIVMEYIDGNTLADVIAAEAPLDYKRVISIGKQIALALSVAHKNNIIHRDVKPHNILITRDGTAKITDFGIAKAINDSSIASDNGMIMGSVHYFSPEQGRGLYVDEKSDIYSLGIVLYEMLTGRVPFDADDPVSIAVMHMNDRIIPPSRIVSGIPPGLEQIVLKATEKYQVDRFNSVDEMYDALNNINFITGIIDNPSVANYVRRDGSGKSEAEKSTEAALEAGGLSAIAGNGSARRNDPIFLDEDDLEPEDDEDYENDFDDDDDDDEKTGFFAALFNLGKKEDKAGSGVNGKKNKTAAENRKFRNLAIILAVVLAIPLSWLLFKGGQWLFSDKTLEVPELLGLTEIEAAQIADDAGFKLKVGGEDYSEVVDEGLIMSQEPIGMERAKKGSTITVLLSKGMGDAEDEEENEDEPTSATVPDVIGKDRGAAEYALTEAGFKKISTDYVDSEKPIDQVVAQNPDGGSKISLDTQISISISKGPKSKEVQMPNLIGLPQDQATTLLAQNSLLLGSVETEYSATAPAGQVIWQQYPAGTKLSDGQSVKIKTSLGPEPAKPLTVKITIDFSSAENDEFLLTVVQTKSDGTDVTLINNQPWYKAYGSEDINVTGTGTGKVTVSFDGTVVKTYNVDFNTGKVT